MSMDYALLKFAHVAGAVLFLGSLSLAGWWIRHARRTGAPGTVAFALDALASAELRFTVPGAVLLLVGGGGLLVVGGGDAAMQGWLSGGILLFLVAALGWAVGLVPLQRQMQRSLNGEQGRELPAACLRLAGHWAWAHLAITAAAFGGLFLMVVRPGS